jgi:hypothetical protein
MGVLSGELADFLDGHRVGVLATRGRRADRGSPWSITPVTETAC